MPPAVAAPATPVATPSPAGLAAAAGRAVPTVAVALDLLVRRGATSARLSLRPEALGGVDVHLRQTALGLDVRLTAEGAEAGRALAASAESLRRQLEGQGLTVLRLEVVEQQASAAGDGPSGERRDAPSQAGTEGRRDGTGGHDARRLAVDLPADPTDPRTTLTLPDGALVDVLA
ncbi:unannotated protein [freshwater metagenome]|uniref:Unannotated protein n=1 Tax=freshwater metagenome TaxID=449393 RepID=A0A6J7I913_9ZZZZ